MSPTDLSILIVDDAKFSARIIYKNLSAGGFTNIRHIQSASVALEIQKENPASVIIADWLMPEMDGLEMTQHIRQMDEADNRYTYVIMLTAKDGIDALKHAFDQGVDDFVNKSVMQQQLLPRVLAAERLVNNHNRLLRENDRLLLEKRQLERVNQKLKGLCTLDSLTGLGNKTYATKKLIDNLKHTDSRGGATCYILLRFSDIAALEKKLPASIIQELILGISRRLKNLVRPLDDVARLDKYSFVVITHQDDIAQCVGTNFKRVLDSINNRAFQTSMGFQNAKLYMSIAATNAELGLPSPEAIMKCAEASMKRAEQTQQIEHIHYSHNVNEC